MATKSDTPVQPPSERTIGQLVADTLHFYGSRFWASLALGFGPAILLVSAATLPRTAQIEVLFVGGPVLMTATYVAACFLTFGAQLDRTRVTSAALAGLTIAFPVLILRASVLFALPTVLWFALLGMAVPAAVVEGTGIRESIRRGFALGRADYAHAAGTLATLVICCFLTATTMFMAVRVGSGQVAAIAAFFALVVVSPLLFIGSALLYKDQIARAAVKSKSH